MIREMIIGKVLLVGLPVEIGEGDKKTLKQTIVVRQNPETDEWSGREFPADIWEMDIIGKEEIERHGLDKTYEPKGDMAMYGTFYVQISSKPVNKRQTEADIKAKTPAVVMYPVNVRLGKVDWSKA